MNVDDVDVFDVIMKSSALALCGVDAALSLVVDGLAAGCTGVWITDMQQV